MAILTKGHTFADGDQVTSTKLNNLVDAAVFRTGTGEAVDNTTLLVDAGGYLKAGVMQTGNLAAGSVTTAKLADSTGASDGVTTAKLATGAVTTAKVGDLAVTADKLAADSVTTAKVLAANITAAKLSGAQTGDAPVYGVRAWVNFDAQRNAAGTSNTLNTTRYLRASGNVTSVTKNGDGDFTLAFTTALPNENYAVSIVASDVSSGGGVVCKIAASSINDTPTTMTTTQLRIGIGTSGNNFNPRTVCVMITG